jgi:hypothetical protein
VKYDYDVVARRRSSVEAISPFTRGLLRSLRSQRHGGECGGVVPVDAAHSGQGMQGRVVMSNVQPNNPLHGITLEMILNQLLEQYGWAELGERIPINCFKENPSIKSSLKFLRRTPWARKKVEDLYLESIAK